MQRSERLPAKPQDEPGNDASVRDANFYALPFASQMVVWAMRKRIGALCRDEPEGGDVLHVFHMANLAELYTSLLAVVNILVDAGVHERSALHAVSCPCLAHHEAYLLNALAHLQNAAREEALLSLCELTAPAGARLAMPQLVTIADEMTARQLRFVYVDLSTLAPRRAGAPPAAGTHGPKRVH